MIGFAFCGSFCTHSEALKVLRELVKEHEVIPIFSQTVFSTDTRFGTAEALAAEAEKLTGHKVIHTVKDAEPFGPKLKPDAIAVCPCTGNTLAKLANGITDTPVCMAVKSVARSDRPVIIALASNDAMSANLGNIGTLLNRKNFYFVPMRQDDTVNKPYSLVADFDQTSAAIISAMQGSQLRPVFI